MNSNYKRVFNIVSVIVSVTVLVFAGTFYGRQVFNATLSAKYNLLMLVPFICFAVTTCFFLYNLLSDKICKYEKFYLVCAICFGIAMQIIMPPISGPDENTHFLSAYHGSNVILLKDDYGQEGPFYQRVEEQKYPAYFESFPEVYQLVADGNWIGVSEAEQQLFLVDEITVSSNRYPLSALGIALARLLHLGVVGLMYAGRVMNMLGMVCFGYFAVKLAPYGKAQIVGFSMLPLILELCNSYSYDGMSIMMTILFTVLCIRYSAEYNKFTWLGIYGLTTVYAFLVPQKTVYMFFAPMILMIPWKKWKGLLFPDRTVKTIVKTSVYFAYFLFTMVLVFRKYLAIAFGILGKSEGEAIEQVSDRPSYTVGYILHNPGKVVELLWSTLKNYAWDDTKNIFGSVLGSHKLEVPVPSYLIVALIICTVIALLIGRGKWIGKRNFMIALIGIIIVLGAIILGCLLRFTPIEGTDRLQVAGRYYLPIFLSLSILLGTDKGENKGTLGVLFIQNCVLIGVMCSVLSFLLTYVHQ